MPQLRPTREKPHAMPTKPRPHWGSVEIRHMPTHGSDARHIRDNSNVQPQPAASAPPTPGLCSAAAAAVSQHRERAQFRREARRRAAPHAETQPCARRGSRRRAGAGNRGGRGLPRLIRFVELLWAKLMLVCRALSQIEAARGHRTLMPGRRTARHRSAIHVDRESLSALLSLHRARAALRAREPGRRPAVKQAHASQALRGVRCSSPEQTPSVRRVERQRRKR
jgi:hypothetical protein